MGVYIFQNQIEGLNAVAFGNVVVNKDQLMVEIQNSDKSMTRVGIESHFKIHHLIKNRLSDIQRFSHQDVYKQHLADLKGHLIKRINSRRGYFSQLSKREMAVLDVYFASAARLIDTPGPGILSSVLTSHIMQWIGIGIGIYGSCYHFGQGGSS
jgi:hypothetical protein